MGKAKVSCIVETELLVTYHDEYHFMREATPGTPLPEP